MSTPFIIIGGGAGSGKDTVAEMLIKGRNGVIIAQADPMKRFAQKAFEFTTDQLWGPSSSRNAEDTRFKDTKMWDQVNENIFFSGLSEKWLREIGAPDAFLPLQKWFEDLQERFFNTERLLTPRAALQTLGTEFGRYVDSNIWSRYTLAAGTGLLAGRFSYTREVGVISDPDNHGHNFVVISDGRFRNEILNVKMIGGKYLKIINPLDESASVEAAGIKGHASEAELKEIPHTWNDHLLYNDKARGLVHLNWDVDNLAIVWRLG